MKIISIKAKRYLLFVSCIVFVHETLTTLIALIFGIDKQGQVKLPGSIFAF